MKLKCEFFIDNDWIEVCEISKDGSNIIFSNNYLNNLYGTNNNDLIFNALIFTRSDTTRVVEKRI